MNPGALLLALVALAPAPAPLPPHVPDANAARAAVPDAYKWNLAPLFPDDAAFAAGLTRAAGLRDGLASGKGKRAGPRALADALDLYFEARLLTNRLTLYANLRLDTAQRDTAAQEMNGRALDAMGDLIALAGGLRDDVLALDEAALAAAVAAEPRLAAYRPYLEGLRRRKARVLGPEAERVLSLAGDNLWAEIDLSTLAHEYGHALHTWLANGTQPHVTAGYAPFVAEIASTVNEKLLSDHLARTAKSDAERLAVLARLAESIRTTIYRQALFAAFEPKAHEAVEQGTPLTAEWLGRAYGELVRTWYGPGFTVGPDDEAEWAMIPHIYYKYYVFSYATGLSAGIAIAERIERLGTKARDAYLGMLKGGMSRPPLTLLKGAGVDLTKPEAVESAARLLDRTLGEMERLMGLGAGGS